MMDLGYIKSMVVMEGDEGFIRLRKDDVNFPDLLEAVEAFQIFCHSPPYNGLNIGEYNRQELIIENVNKLEGLCKRLSTDELSTYGR